MIDWIIDWLIGKLVDWRYPDTAQKRAEIQAKAAAAQAAMDVENAALEAVLQQRVKTKALLDEAQTGLRETQNALSLAFTATAKAMAEVTRLNEEKALVEAEAARKRAAIDALSDHDAVRIDL